MSRWFRLYDEILDDPKVQLLSPEMFRTWINVMALASRTNGKLPSTQSMAFSLRLTAADMQARIDELILVGLIDIMADRSLEPHNWSKRQWKSDDSAERVKKHRATKKQQETGGNTVTETKCNGAVTVTATAPDTESDTEKKKIVACDPDGVRFENNAITLDASNWNFWLPHFGGDAEALSLALMQASGFIQVNDRSKPLAAKVGAQLAMMARAKRERDSRYQSAKETNRATASTSGRPGWVVEKERKSAAARAAMEEVLSGLSSGVSNVS